MDALTPREVGAAIDHSLLNLKDDAKSIPLSIVDRNLAIERRGGEGGLDATFHTKIVRVPKLFGQSTARDTTVHLVGSRQLGGLDNRRIDQVQRGFVCVQRIRLLFELLI